MRIAVHSRVWRAVSFRRWSGGGLWYALIALVGAAAMPAFARHVLIIAGATEGATHDLPVIQSNPLAVRISGLSPATRECVRIRWRSMPST